LPPIHRFVKTLSSVKQAKESALRRRRWNYGGETKLTAETPRTPRMRGGKQGQNLRTPGERRALRKNEREHGIMENPDKEETLI